MAEDGGGRLGFGDDAERHIAFGETIECFRRLRRVLVFGDDLLEAIDASEIRTAIELVTADLHFLAGQMIARQNSLFAGILRIS